MQTVALGQGTIPSWTIDAPAVGSSRAPVWDTTEVPAGLTFNPAEPAPTAVAAAQKLRS